MSVLGRNRNQEKASAARLLDGRCGRGSPTRTTLALFLLSAALPGLAVPLAAQTAGNGALEPPEAHGFVATTWTTSDGLPQNSVNDILETRDGRFWLATFGGLARIDGSTFDVLDVAELPELRSNRMLALAEGDQGDLWVTTSSGEILRISEDRVLERIEIPGRRGPLHNGLRLGASGELIQGRYGALGIFENGEWRDVPGEGAPPSQMLAIDVDQAGYVWIATGTGLARFDGNLLESVVRDTSSRSKPVAAAAVRVDHRGRVWFSTPEGVSVFDPRLGRADRLRIEGLEAPLGMISAIETGGDDEIWVGGANGIAQLRIDPGRYTARVLYQARPPNDRSVTKIIRDRKGAIWIGTRGGGLLRLAPRRLRILTQADGLPSREINHTIGGPGDGVRVAGGCQGVAEVRVGNAPEIRLLGLSRYGSCASGMTVDPEGNLWITFRDTGHLVRIPAQPGGEVRSWGPTDGIDRNRLVQPPVALPDGSVWFGYGLGGLGHVRDTSLTLYDPGFGLPADEITSMAFDPDGDLWVGQSGTIAVVPVSGSELGEVRVMGPSEGVPPGAIRLIHRDRKGDVWIGSYGGGLARCSDDGSRFDRLTTAQGLPDNSLSALLEDSKDRFWILGNRGVSVVRRAVLDSVIEGTRARIDAVQFDADDGMPEGNGGSPAAWLGEDGVAWFSTIDGLVSIDTGAFPWDTIAPLPLIESIRFGEEDWKGSGPVIVGGGGQQVSFRYSASSAATLDEAMYRHRLVGQDDDWVYSVRSGEARYPRVPPGTYTFVVEARNEDGLWSVRPASVDIRILPLWWQTNWFRGGAGLLVVGLIASGLFRRVRIVELRARKLELAIEERDRAEERARRQQRELEHVSRIATAGELATSLAHELNQPLMAIVSNAAASDRLLSNPDIGRDVVREALAEIMHEGRRASDVITELREFLKRGRVETEPLRINQLVRDALLLLGSELRETAVEIDLDLAPDLPDVLGNRVQLQQVLINLIMNSLDAMRNLETERRITIRTRALPPFVEVRVRDTGPGLPPDEVASVFEAFVTTKSSGMGVGLAISRSLVQAHGGRIEAANDPAGGAVLTFTLPARFPGRDLPDSRQEELVG